MRHLTFFAAGVLFAAGLILAGMTQPAKIVGFLDFAGNWDPSLAFVMLGAIGVHAISYRLIMKRSSPILAPKFLIPTRRDIDMPLVAGSILFGVGWGLGGFCPGPGLVATGSGSVHAGLFVVALVAGHLVFAAYSTLQARLRARTPERSRAVGRV